MSSGIVHHGLGGVISGPHSTMPVNVGGAVTGVIVTNAGTGYSALGADPKIYLTPAQYQEFQLLTAKRGALSQAEINQMLGLPPSPNVNEGEQPEEPEKIEPPKEKLEQIKDIALRLRNYAERSQTVAGELCLEAAEFIEKVYEDLPARKPKFDVSNAEKVTFVQKIDPMRTYDPERVGRDTAISVVNWLMQNNLLEKTLSEDPATGMNIVTFAFPLITDAKIVADMENGRYIEVASPLPIIATTATASSRTPSTTQTRPLTGNEVMKIDVPEMTGLPAEDAHKSALKANEAYLKHIRDIEVKRIEEEQHRTNKITTGSYASYLKNRLRGRG